MTHNFKEAVITQQVTKGQTFKSYAALCKHIGIPATTGKQRQLDQDYLQHYFTWEKADGSSQITITETFYTCPKPFEDGRKGIHTTRLNTMMQNLILSTPWNDSFMSKYKIISIVLS